MVGTRQLLPLLTVLGVLLVGDAHGVSPNLAREVVVGAAEGERQGASLGAESITPQAPPASEIRWSVVAPAYTLRPVVGEDSQLYQRVAVDGWTAFAEAGAPALPSTSTLVVLPPVGDVTLDVEVHGRTVVPLSAPVLPGLVPEPRNGAEPASQVGMAWAPDAAIYNGRAPFPPEAALLTEVGIFRGVRLARLTVMPFRFNPADQSLIVLDQVAVKVRFENIPDRQSQAVASLDPLHAGLGDLVLNPEDMGRFRTTRDTAPTGSAEPPVALQAQVPAQVQFALTEPGLYALPWEILVSSGILPEDGDPDGVRLHRPATGAEVALSWQPAARRFLFYAAPASGRWAAEEIYRVTYGEPAGLRMTTRPCVSPAPYQVYLPLITVATTGGEHSARSAPNARIEVVVEENHRYDSLHVSPRDDQSWYWACLQAPASYVCPASLSHTVQLDAPSELGEAEIEIWVQGYTRTDHRLQVTVNGYPVGTADWTGKKAFAAPFTFPAHYLRDGENEVRLHLDPEGFGGVWLDAFALRHPITTAPTVPLHFLGQEGYHVYTLDGVDGQAGLYDVTDPDRPQQLVGCEVDGERWTLAETLTETVTYYLGDVDDAGVISDLQPLHPMEESAGAGDGSADYDYIAIAPAAWLDELAPLLAHREAQGLKTYAVSLEAIFDHFGAGRMDPEAIRAFVAHAYQSWSPQPRYLLLVGDGTWDPLDYLETGTRTWLPPYLADVDPWMGEAPADNRYAAVDGEDAIPDMAVGRLPVNSAEELRETVAKTLAYEQDTAVRLWKMRHLLVVDNDDGVNDFAGSAAAVTSLAPPSHTVSRLQMPDDGTQSLEQQRARLFPQLAQGALVVSWTGHSSWQQWEHRRLFHTDDLVALDPTPRLPLILEMTCFTSNFAHPEPQHTALDEALVRLPGAGAVATWGSSGGGLDAAHQQLHVGIYDALFGADPRRVGDATLLAKLQAPAGEAHLIDTFHLLGDPALVLQRTARPHVLYLPLVSYDRTTPYTTHIPLLNYLARTSR